jgi:hypothetical protein
MADLAHQFGSDLTANAMGDIALADGTFLGQQRVLKRLLTNPGDYIWHIGYGAGLARFVGLPANGARITAVARTQMLLEAVVARTPAPAVSVVTLPTGEVTLTINYVDAPSDQTVTLPVPLPVTS